jgi:hypothetical protein
MPFPSFRVAVLHPSDCKAAAAACLLFTGLSVASTAALAEGTGAAAPDAPLVAAEPAWEFEVAGYGYFIPDDDDYLQPTVTADRGWLHLEARYNYEDRDTASAWLGYNFGGAGEDVEWSFTPMLGAVAGNTDGVAPGYRGWVTWRRLEFSSEGEYLFDADDSDGNFAYTWSELGAVPRDWWRFGLVVQRTRVYDTDLAIQRGLYLGVSGGWWSLTAYVFNPDESADRVLVAGATARF